MVTVSLLVSQPAHQETEEAQVPLTRNHILIQLQRLFIRRIDTNLLVNDLSILVHDAVRRDGLCARRMHKLHGIGELAVERAGKQYSGHFGRCQRTQSCIVISNRKEA